MSRPELSGAIVTNIGRSPAKGFAAPRTVSAVACGTPVSLPSAARGNAASIAAAPPVARSSCPRVSRTPRTVPERYREGRPPILARDVGRRRRPSRGAASARDHLPPAEEHAFGPLLRSIGDARPPSHVRVPPDRRPAEGDRGAGRVAPRGEPRADAARRDGHGQDRHDGVGDGGAPAPVVGDRPQQDARRAALQRVPRVLPGQRRRVLRLLLRLLPARGVRPAGRPLHREGLVAERRHRAAAARRDELAPDPPRRRRRRVRELHLRPRLARGMAREGPHPRGRVGARPRRDAAHADRLAVRPQRHGARPRPLPGPGRRDRGAAGERRDRVPHLDVRRRGRADLALRPAHR